MERGLALGGLGLLAGLGLLGWALVRWWGGEADSAAVRHTTTLALVGATLGTLGFQTVLFSFFASLLGMHRR
jgi:hypothetical protein